METVNLSAARRIVREMRADCDTELARMDGETTGFKWGLFFGALAASLFWSRFV